MTGVFADSFYSFALINPHEDATRRLGRRIDSATNSLVSR